mmetsp:Transcript_25950/g.76061  ORF Transcript_25950/g.76061 Transcript_25950/m.76061 type:complete len:310 (+) Transcript_25950:481-1410(+)
MGTEKPTRRPPRRAHRQRSAHFPLFSSAAMRSVRRWMVSCWSLTQHARTDTISIIFTAVCSELATSSGTSSAMKPTCLAPLRLNSKHTESRPASTLYACSAWRLSMLVLAARDDVVSKLSACTLPGTRALPSASKEATVPPPVESTAFPSSAKSSKESPFTSESSPLADREPKVKPAVAPVTVTCAGLVGSSLCMCRMELGLAVHMPTLPVWSTVTLIKPGSPLTAAPPWPGEASASGSGSGSGSGTLGSGSGTASLGSGSALASGSGSGSAGTTASTGFSSASGVGSSGAATGAPTTSAFCSSLMAGA